MTTISVEGILRAKAPRISGRIPGGLVRLLARLIHEDELNHILTAYDTGDPFEFLRGFFGYTGVSYEAVGLEGLRRDGRYIFAANHPFGGMDGMMLAERIGSHFGDVRVIVNDILMYLDPLKGIFVPVNKSGTQRGAYAVAFNEAFAGPAPVLTFPAGLCSRCGTDGVVADIDWRPNFIKRAAQTDRLIVPVYVEGRLSKRFYRWARWRKRLGVRFNVEQIFLPDEMFRQRGQHFRLVFGAPVPVSELRAATGATDPRVLAAEVRRRSYALQAGME
ncbi:MAG: acyltransferase [Alistipes sp.]|jgi:putative hemolysin|nr:acyltransferase [Alistipes sp.]